MPDRLSILAVNTRDTGGGAERIASDLRRLYGEAGHASYLAVGRKLGTDADVYEIRRGAWYTAWQRAAVALDRHAHNRVGATRLARLARRVSQPRHWRRDEQGYDIPRYRDSASVVRLAPTPPDVVHLHNLHGTALGHRGYFDLTALPELSRRVPLFATLHDAWLLSGHCAHSFACERWRTGCGACPDLTIYPAIAVDRTAENWRERQEIFSRTRLHVATPSAWLMERVRGSLLAPAIVEGRVIPNGVDLTIFNRGDRAAARASLGLDGLTPDTRVALVTANALKHNVFKDHRTMREAILRLPPGLGDVLFLAVGGGAAEEQIGRVRLRTLPFEADQARIAAFYRAADIYVHPAKADTFPTSVLEALACGLPVVATRVGGIPEQVRSVSSADGTDAATGVLTSPGDAVELAAAIAMLLLDADLRQRLGERAALDARDRFDIRAQARTYLEWYAEVLDRR